MAFKWHAKVVAAMRNEHHSQHANAVVQMLGKVGQSNANVAVAMLDEARNIHTNATVEMLDQAGSRHAYTMVAMLVSMLTKVRQDTTDDINCPVIIMMCCSLSCPDLVTQQMKKRDLLQLVKWVQTGMEWYFTATT